MPSLASTTPTWPSLTVTKGTTPIEYCQGQRQKCSPGASVSAWTPASPFSATILPSGSIALRPPRLNFFVTIPTPLLGMITSPRMRISCL